MSRRLALLPLSIILSSVLITTGCNQSDPGTHTATPSVSPVPGACGKKDAPDCPTQQWMKATLQSHLRTGDFSRLARALRTVADKAPAGYSGWAQLAEKGEAAARARDRAGVQRSCKSCHKQFRARFRQEQREVVLF